MSLMDILGCAAVVAPAAICITLTLLGAFDDGRP